MERLHLLIDDLTLKVNSREEFFDVLLRDHSLPYLGEAHMIIISDCSIKRGMSGSYRYTQHDFCNAFRHIKCFVPRTIFIIVGARDFYVYDYCREIMTRVEKDIAALEMLI